MKTNLSLSRFSLPRFLAVSTVALALPLSALAAGHNMDRNGRGDHDRGGFSMQHEQGMPGLRGIDLTAAQVTQLSAMRDEQKKLFTEKHQALRDQHDALHKLVMSDAYTPAAAAEIIAKIGTAQTEMAKLHAEQANKLYKLLTPEQRTKMQQNELLGNGPMGRGHKR